jgi:transposase InsO family protein
LYLSGASGTKCTCRAQMEPLTAFIRPDLRWALRHEVERLKSENTILRRRIRGNRQTHHTWKENLHILWHMEIFNVPRRQVEGVFGIARSTYYRGLRQAAAGTLAGKKSGAGSPANKTPDGIPALVWRMFDSNPHLGREKIAQMIQRLNVFFSPSAVRNISRRGKPRRPEVTPARANPEEPQVDTREYPGIVSKYPNHVWSIDLTIVKRWLLWPTYILVGIDHYSPKIVCASPLEGPNSGWTIEAFEQAILRCGKPKHLITDQGTVFTSNAFRNFLEQWGIKRRLGAAGKHGSIAVTERAVKTMKTEWLGRVPLIRGFDHLTDLCRDFLEWHNTGRLTYDNMRLPETGWENQTSNIRIRKIRKYLISRRISRTTGGGGGIRTHGRVAPSPVFKTGAFNRTRPPHRAKRILARLLYGG